MKFSIILILIFITSSCSMFGDAFKKAAVHEKMVTQLDQTPYEMNLTDLQAKVVEYMGSMNLNGKWVYTANPGGNQLQRMTAINEQMEEGFVYKQNFYSSTWSPDMSLFSGDMDKIKKSIFTSSYHVIENNENEFIIVKGNTIYEAHKAGVNKSSLKVYQLTDVVRPLDVNLDWWKLLRGKGLLANLSQGPVDFASSRKYQEEDKVRKISLFFFIDKERAEKMEADLLAKQES
ncbi:MAG: hypothetical protein H7177_16285 [Rhizobacter sp.]|nr:hypothetical protein [Bacteriovorax sp.]